MNNNNYNDNGTSGTSESCRIDHTPQGPMHLKPMPFEIMEEVVFIPFPIGGH